MASRNTKAAQVAQAVAGGVAVAAVAEDQTKTVKVSKKIVVGTGFNADELLRLDTEGVDLIFEQTEKFLPLEDTLVTQLSNLNRTRYSMAREFHDAWRGEEHAAFTRKFEVDRQMVGSASDKLTVGSTNGLHTRWTRPDRLADVRAKGYRVLSDDEANSYLGPTVGHHEIGRLGQTELVLTGIPEELFRKRQAEKAVKNSQMAGAYQRAALGEMAKAGGQPFVASDENRDRQHVWSDIGPTEEGG